MSNKTAKELEALYDELAAETKRLAMFRRFRDAAQERMDDAIREETDNIARETERVIAAATRVAELVAELGIVSSSETWAQTKVTP